LAVEWDTLHLNIHKYTAQYVNVEGKRNVDTKTRAEMLEHDDLV